MLKADRRILAAGLKMKWCDDIVTLNPRQVTERNVACESKHIDYQCHSLADDSRFSFFNYQ